MYHTLQQTYRHHIQQAIVRQEMHLRPTPPGIAWQTYGVLTLFAAAAACGALAQLHLG